MNLALSLFLGGLGIDRMVNGCVKQGFEKLLVGWIPLVGLPIQGLWWLTDVGTAALSKDGYIGCRKNKGEKTRKNGRLSKGWSKFKGMFTRKKKPETEELEDSQATQEGGKTRRRRRRRRRRRTRVKKRRRRRKTRHRRG